MKDLYEIERENEGYMRNRRSDSCKTQINLERIGL